jgi:3-phosphoshikimate 1-carboxyvinyltransferase
MNVTIHQSTGLKGAFTVPGDKSISHRALLLGALAEGKSTILGLSTAADVASTAECLKALGVDIRSDSSHVEVHGKGPRGFRKPGADLSAGNSGTTMRLLAGILSGQRFDSVLSGDASLNKRPMKRIIDPLRLMGANITGTTENTAPLKISSTYSLRPIHYELHIPTAQVKSAILLAGLYADGKTTVTEPVATRDHTERMLGLKTVPYGNGRTIEIRGGQKVPTLNSTVPGDISAATFLIAAAAIVPHSEIVIRNVGMNSTRTAVLDIFRRMGVTIDVRDERSEAGEPFGDLHVRTADLSTNVTIKGEEVALLIDELPMLSVMSLFGDGVFTLHDAAELRGKESDRISALVTNLKRLGVDVEEYTDGFAFRTKKNLIGCEIDSFGDHRIAMAFGVAGLRIPGVTIRDAECVNISFPGFWNTLQA